MRIRLATETDATSACEVLRRSIVELCAADHDGVRDVVDEWLANKTPETVARWINRSDSTVLVAVEGDEIVSVGVVSNSGEILLNYVSPTARFRGVSKAMMAALEARAREAGNDRCRLVSTRTARRFYLDAGYVADGTAKGCSGGDEGLAMTKVFVVFGESGVAEPVPLVSPKSNCRVRDGEVTDRLGLRDLWAATWRATYEPLVGLSGIKDMIDGLAASSFRDMIPDDARTLVAVRDGRIVGSAIFADRRATTYLWGMYIHPDVQRRGVGTDLLRQVAARLPPEALIEVSVLRSSPWAQSFYSTLGFRNASTCSIKLTRTDPGRPATIMTVGAEDLRKRLSLSNS